MYHNDHNPTQLLHNIKLFILSLPELIVKLGYIPLLSYTLATLFHTPIIFYTTMTILKIILITATTRSIYLLYKLINN